MSPDESEFVDRIGLFFETLGGSRTMGRIYGWLMICDPPDQSLTDLARELGVSKASISTVARQLQEGALVERVPAATRAHRYRLTPGGFTHVLRVQLERMRPGVDAVEQALSTLPAGRERQREVLEEFGDFCEFSTHLVAGEFMRRWEEYRTRRRSGR